MSSDEGEFDDRVQEEDEEEAGEPEPEGEELDDDDDDEEEEEEGQDDYDRTDGWLVDEVEGEEREEEEEHDSEEEARKERKRKKRRKEQEELDEDDYDLLEDAGVLRSRPVHKEGDKKFKRLKKARKVGDMAEGSYQVDEDAEEEEGAEGQTAEERLKHRLFGDDEGIHEDVPEDAEPPPEEEEEMGEEDEMDDFIVDETDENGDPVRRRRHKKSRAYGSGIAASALQEAHDIFGDVTELIQEKLARDREIEAAKEAELLGEEEYDEQGYRRPVMSARALANQYEPSVLEAKYMTDKDERMRQVDVPERIQLLEQVVGPVPSKEDTRPEAEWIFDRVFGAMAIPPRPEFQRIRDLEDRARNMSGNKEAAERLRADASQLRDEAVQEIANVLQLMHDKKLEVPFIGMHRKKVCKDLLYPRDENEEDRPHLNKFEALWAVQQMDKRWLHLQRRKRVLRSAYERPRIDPDETAELQLALSGILAALEEAQTEQAVDDVDAKVNLQFPPEDAVPAASSKNRLRRPKKRSLYSDCRKAGLGAVTKYFGLTAYKFGENLQALYKQNEVEDEPRSPEEVAAEHVGLAFPDSKSVLRGARHMMEVEMSVEPGVREHVRSVFMERAVVNTRATESGKDAMDQFHRYAVVKWLKDKPVIAFDNEQWLLIAKAEEEGLLKVTVELPQVVVNEMLLNEFENAYLSDGVSKNAELWNEQRRQILRDALVGRLLPFMQREMRSTLATRARQHLSDLFAASLWSKVSVASYASPGKHSDPESQDGAPGIRVAACLWGPGSPATTVVMLDRYGEYVNHIHVGHLTMGGKLEYKDLDNLRGRVPENLQRKHEDMERLLEFLMEYKPHVVALGGANLQCKRLRTELEEAFLHIREWHPRQMAQEGGTPVWYEEEALAQLFENSPVSQQQLQGHPGIVRRAVGLGRMMQNRLAMVASLCGHSREILSLKLHPLQDLLTDDERYEAIEKVMVTVTNQVGVDVNLAVNHEWLAAPMQFVAGLGPRKASHLQRQIRGEGVLKTRRELIDNGWMGKTVFVNAASALRIRGQDDPLDDTRIHPETYELAQKMALEAYCEAERMEPEEVESRDLDVVTEIKDSPGIIESLDLRAYADELQAKGMGNEYPVLLHIKRELMAGYREWREAYQQLNAEEEFYLLTGESPDSLAVGRMVQATVRRAQQHRLICALESGVTAMIDERDLSDERNVDPGSVAVDSVMTCCVKEVKPQEYRVDLSCRRSDMESNHWMSSRHWDTYYVHDLSSLMTEEEKAKKKAEEEKRKLRTFKPRMINFPLFQNISMAEAAKQLADKEVGDVIIRPSTKGPSNLSLTLKFFDDVYTQLDIVESGKDRRDVTSFLRLGKTLTIGEESYEDLDEVVARYVDPLVSHLREMIKYRKFRRGSLDEIEDALRQEKMDTPGRVPYYIGISYKHPGALVLCYIRFTAPRHEYITVSPKGFRFRKRDFASPDKLVKYFQAHFNEPILEAPRRAVAAMVAPRSPAPGGGYPGGGAYGGAYEPSTGQGAGGGPGGGWDRSMPVAAWGGRPSGGGGNWDSGSGGGGGGGGGGRGGGGGDAGWGAGAGQYPPNGGWAQGWNPPQQQPWSGGPPGGAYPPPPPPSSHYNPSPASHYGGGGATPGRTPGTAAATPMRSGGPSPYHGGRGYQNGTPGGWAKTPNRHQTPVHQQEVAPGTSGWDA